MPLTDAQKCKAYRERIKLKKVTPTLTPTPPTPADTDTKEEFMPQETVTNENARNVAEKVYRFLVKNPDQALKLDKYVYQFVLEYRDRQRV